MPRWEPEVGGENSRFLGSCGEEVSSLSTSLRMQVLATLRFSESWTRRAEGLRGTVRTVAVGAVGLIVTDGHRGGLVIEGHEGMRGSRDEGFKPSSWLAEVGILLDIRLPVLIFPVDDLRPSFSTRLQQAFRDLLETELTSCYSEVLDLSPRF